MGRALNSAMVRQDVAEMLYLSPQELSDETDLLDSGLDSVRLLTLVERWRERGVDIGLVELAERPTLGAWLALLESRQGGADG